MWDIVIDKPIAKNLDKIFPLKQRDVDIFVTLLKDNPNIEEIIIFGSSTRASCNQWSDIDIYIKSESLKATIELEVSFNEIGSALDIWFSTDELSDELLREIIQKGVTVWTKHI